MKLEDRVKQLEKENEVFKALLLNPSGDAENVLYLVNTVRTMEQINFDLTNKWNTAAAYLKNKGLVPEYNAWVTKMDGITDPNMKMVFANQPIDRPPAPEETSAPELCGKINPHKDKMACVDIKLHEGDIHMGVDNDGKMFKWTEEKNLGQVEQEDLPEAPSEIHEYRVELTKLLKERVDAEQVYTKICDEIGLKPEDDISLENIKRLIDELTKLAYIEPPEDAILPSEETRKEPEEPETSEVPEPPANVCAKCEEPLDGEGNFTCKCHGDSEAPEEKLEEPPKPEE